MINILSICFCQADNSVIKAWVFRKWSYYDQNQSIHLHMANVVHLVLLQELRQKSVATNRLRSSLYRTILRQNTTWYLSPIKQHIQIKARLTVHHVHVRSTTMFFKTCWNMSWGYVSGVIANMKLRDVWATIFKKRSVSIFHPNSVLFPTMPVHKVLFLSPWKQVPELTGELNCCVEVCISECSRKIVSGFLFSFFF